MMKKICLLLISTCLIMTMCSIGVLANGNEYEMYNFNDANLIPSYVTVNKHLTLNNSLSVCIDNTINYPTETLGKSVYMRSWEDYCRIFFNFPVQASMTYNVECMVRLHETSSVAKDVKLYIYNSTSDTILASFNIVALETGVWSKISGEFTVPQSITTINVGIGTPSAELENRTIINIDNVSIRQIYAKAEISCFRAFDDGTKIDTADYIENGHYTIHTSINNLTQEAQPITVISALYANEQLISVQGERKYFGVGEQIYDVFWDLSNIEFGLAQYSIKNFVWLDSMSPVCPSKYIFERNQPVDLASIENTVKNEQDLPPGIVVLKDYSIFNPAYASTNFEEYSDASTTDYKETALYANDSGAATLIGKSIADEDMPFSHIVNCNITTLPETKNKVMLTVLSNTTDIHVGDKVLISFYMRCLNSLNDDGTGAVEIKYQTNESPWDASLLSTVYCTPEWNKCYVSFTAKYNHTAGNSALLIRFGLAVQEIEIGGFCMTNYGDSVSVNDFPITQYTSYDGMLDDATWRIAANERIEAIRKGNISIVVKDGDNQTVSGAKVSIAMKRHMFDFGGTVWTAPAEFGNDAFFNTVLQNFNTVVPGNVLKWPYWETDRQRALNVVDWSNSNGLKIRGHNLIWDSVSHMPVDVATIQNDEAAINERIYNHITDIVTATKDKIYEWDVLNEPVLNVNLREKYGYNMYVNWFAWARSANPDAMLYVNDPSVVGVSVRRYTELKEILQNMVSNNVDFDGIGLECHFSAPCSIDAFYSQLNELSAFNKKIKITEYDIKATEAMRAYFTRDLLTIAFSHPSVNGFLMWNWWDTSTDSNGVMYYNDFKLKPAGEQMLDLMYHQWWTNEIGESDNTGLFNTRGFFGDYEITVAKDGVVKKQEVQVLPGQNNLFEVSMN